MGKSIDGIGRRREPPPLLILSMSLQPAIPWRVALQQSPTPLHRLSTMLKEKQRLEKTITLNGNCVFRRLSQSRGSPHDFPGLKVETWGTQAMGLNQSVSECQ